MSPIAERRTYGQHCALARALDLVGGRWTLLIVRNLLVGPQRYSDLLEGLPGITTNLLAGRLREMEGSGIIERRAGPGRAAVYALTDRGRELEAAVMALGRWGDPLMAQARPGDRYSLRWALLRLKRRYRGGAAMRVELRTREGPLYSLHLEPDSLEVRECPTVSPELILSGAEGDLLRLVVRGDRTAPVEVEGQPGALDRFLCTLLS